MSDTSQGPGWWMASDGKWYPPHLASGEPQPQPEPRVHPEPQPQPGPMPSFEPPQPVASSQAGPAPIPVTGAIEPTQKKKSGCIKWMLIALGLFVVMGVAVTACIALVADDVADGIDEFEAVVEEQIDELEDAANDAKDTSEDSDNAGSESSNDSPGGDEIDDIVGCTRIDEDHVEVELVNNSSKTSTYLMTVAFLDGSGTRLADEFGSISHLRAGERAIEKIFTFESVGEVCEVIDVDRTASESDPDELAEVSDCAVNGEDGLGDASASVQAINGSSKNSDYQVSVAFIDAEGVRRGTGFSLIEVVRAGESAPGDIFSTVDFVDGMTCEIVHVDRTFAAGSQDAGTAESNAAGDAPTGEAADVTSCVIIDADTIQLEATNNSNETSNYWITVGYFDEDGNRVADGDATISALRPGEKTIETTFRFEEGGATCEILDVERTSSAAASDELDDAVSCEIGGPDFADHAEAIVTVTNDSSKASNYSIVAAFVDADGTRRGTGSAFIETVRPDETAPGDIFGTVDFNDGLKCEIVHIERSEDT